MNSVEIVERVECTASGNTLHGSKDLIFILKEAVKTASRSSKDPKNVFLEKIAMNPNLLISSPAHRARERGV